MTKDKTARLYQLQNQSHEHDMKTNREYYRKIEIYILLKCASTESENL